MFFHPFAKSDYKEQDWVAVFLLESFLRSVVSTVSEEFIGCSEEQMLTRFEKFLSYIGFPPSELDVPDGLVKGLVCAEFASVQVFATECLDRKKRGESNSAQEARLEYLQFEENMMKRLKTSSPFAEVVTSLRTISCLDEMRQHFEAKKC